PADARHERRRGSRRARREVRLAERRRRAVSWREDARAAENLDSQPPAPYNAPMDHPRRVCIVGASGKLGRYMVRHALDRGYEVVGVCREQSIPKLDEFADRIELHGGATDDREVVQKAVAGCDGVLVVLVPWGMNHYASGTALAVLDLASRDARLVFSSGWWPSRDGQDVYPWSVKRKLLLGRLARLARVVDLDDQAE